MYLQDIVNAATEAAIHAAYAKARADALKAAAIGAAERVRASTGAHIREVASDQRLGTLRLDAAGLPAAPKVVKPEEVTSWLVEHAPHLVEASIRVPVEKLEQVLSMLEFAGIPEREVSARVDFRDAAEASAWLVEHCIVQADPDVPRSWNVLHRDAEGHTTPVPGVIGAQPNPYWVIRTDDTHRASAVATARAEAEGLVAQLRQQDAADSADSADAPDTSAVRAALEGAGFDYAEIEHSFEGLTDPIGGRRGFTTPEAAEPEDVPEGMVTPLMPRPVLVARARELGLPVGGNKAELVSRINTAPRTR